MSLFSGQDVVCVRGERMVFSGLGFDLDPGQVLVLVGPNGSGKSSLLRLMTGLLRPASGRLEWEGEAITGDLECHGARLHYVGHLDAVKSVLTVAENLEFWAGPDSGSRGAVEAGLAAFGIAHLAEVPGLFLSAGQKRRLALARLAASPARLWLLDEPTTALDAAAVASLEGAVAKHRAGGGMAVVSTHTGLALGDARTIDLADFMTVPGAP